MSCKCCGGEPEPKKQWCKAKACQEHKLRHQRSSKNSARKRYTPPKSIRDGKLNGRFCQYTFQNDEICGVPLKGWNFFNCPHHQKAVDGYELRTNVCL